MTDRERHRRKAWGFARQTLGRHLLQNGALGANPSGAQCVNVPNTWWATRAVSNLFGDARDWYGQSTTSLQWHVMSSRLRPRVGDVAVWVPGGEVSDFGHVSVVMWDYGAKVLSLDQDWPTGAPVSYVLHDREVLAGVIRIRGW